MYDCFHDGILAQLGERSTEDAKVHGSIDSIDYDGFSRPDRQYDETDEIPSTQFLAKTGAQRVEAR